MFNADEYSTWAREEMHIRFDSNLSIRGQGGEERGIYVKSSGETSPMSTLISVPMNSILSVRSIDDSFLPFLQHAVDTLREDDVLALCILHEKFVSKEASKWYKHICILPSIYHSVPNFTQDELEFLKGTNLHQLAGIWQKQIRGDYEQLQSKEKDLLSKHFSWLTFDLYVWALSTIWSRCISIFIPQCHKFGIKENVVRGLVPFVDLLNHRPGSRASHAYKDGFLHILSETGFCADEEIFITYGTPSNSRLLQLYGFALSGNPHASVEVYASLPQLDGRASDTLPLKISVLQHFEIDSTNAVFELATAPPVTESDFDNLATATLEGLPAANQKLLLFLRVVAITEKHLSAVAKFIKDKGMKLAEKVVLISILGNSMKCFQSPVFGKEFEIAACKGYERTLRQMLNGYASDNTSDDKLWLKALENIDKNNGEQQNTAYHEEVQIMPETTRHRLRMSLELRISEKEVLISNIDFITAYLSKLHGL